MDIIKKIISRIKLMLGKALLQAVYDDNELQLVKITGLDGEVQDRVERLQNYGLTSNPPRGSGGLVANLGGNKDHPLILAMDSGKYRKKGLKEGEVALYDKNGTYILLKENGDMEIYTKRNYVLNPDGTLMLGGDSLLPTAGVVTGECLDPVTGVPFPDKSAKVFAAKA